jgi:hypothetical protein
MSSFRSFEFFWNPWFAWGVRSFWVLRDEGLWLQVMGLVRFVGKEGLVLQEEFMEIIKHDLVLENGPQQAMDERFAQARVIFTLKLCHCQGTALLFSVSNEGPILTKEWFVGPSTYWVLSFMQLDSGSGHHTGEVQSGGLYT